MSHKVGQPVLPIGKSHCQAIRSVASSSIPPCWTMDTDGPQTVFLQSTIFVHIQHGPV